MQAKNSGSDFGTRRVMEAMTSNSSFLRIAKVRRRDQAGFVDFNEFNRYRP